MNSVPIDFQIGSYPHAAWSAGSKDVGQIEENRFLPARGKAEIVPRRQPTTMAVRDFQAQPVSVPAVALSDGHIHRRLRVVDRTLGDKKERSAFRRVLAEVHFKIVIPRDALILSAPKAG